MWKEGEGKELGDFSAYLVVETGNTEAEGAVMCLEEVICEDVHLFCGGGGGCFGVRLRFVRNLPKREQVFLSSLHVPGFRSEILGEKGGPFTDGPERR